MKHWICDNIRSAPQKKSAELEVEIIAYFLPCYPTLRLYCDVPLRDVRIKEASGEERALDSDAEGENGRLTYLLGDERGEALLAFEVSPGDTEDSGPAPDLSDFLLLRLRASHPVDCVERITDALYRKYDGKAKGREGKYRPGWSCQLTPIPEQLRGALERAGLLEEGGEAPTEYGIDFGIVRGYYLKDRDERHRAACAPFCTERVLRNLKELLEQEHAPDMSWRQRPFAERIRRLSLGIPSNEAYCVTMVRRFARTPLESYLRDFPEDLTALREAAISETATYQQAAAAVYQMLQSEEEQERGKELMQHLAAPLVSEYREKHRR